MVFHARVCCFKKLLKNLVRVVVYKLCGRKGGKTLRRWLR